jgi:hypothetical protein
MASTHSEQRRTVLVHLGYSTIMINYAASFPSGGKLGDGVAASYGKSALIAHLRNDNRAGLLQGG